MRRFIALLTALLLVPPLLRADPQESVRQEFREALAAASDGRPTEASADSEALRGYVLYAYVEDARLELALRQAARGGYAGDMGPLDSRIEEFLARHGTEPVARGLRRQWLDSLATRSMWETYLQQYNAEVDTSKTLGCHALVARTRLGRTEGLEQDIAATWLSPESLPDACDPAFDWMKERGRLTNELIEQRGRLALEAGEAGLARYLARSLPESSAAPLLQWASLIEQPAASIDALIANPARAVEPQALLAGWTRLARRDPDGAASRYPGLVQARKLDAAAASPYAIATGLGASWSRKPYALEFFARGQAQDFDDVAHEWHVRAALWSGDWSRVRSAIAAMPAKLREELALLGGTLRRGPGRQRSGAQRLRRRRADRQLVRGARSHAAQPGLCPDTGADGHHGSRHGGSGGAAGHAESTGAPPLRHAQRSHERVALDIRTTGSCATATGHRHRLRLGLAPRGGRGCRKARPVQRLRAPLSPPL